MKAIAVFPKERAIRVIDHPEPNISAPSEVKIQMLEVGICGTDKELCSFEYGWLPTGSDYLIIGHESLGRIVEVGSAVRNLKVGDLVYIMVRRPCKHDDCVPCGAGRQDFCDTGDFTERGINQIHGFMTEYVVEHEQYLVLVPQELRHVAVLTDPLTIAEKALEQVWVVQERLPWEIRHQNSKRDPKLHTGYKHNALVLGAGAVGLMGAMALSNQEFNTYVYSNEPVTDIKAALVKSIGATYISAADCTLDQLAEKIGRIDIVYEAAGASKLAFDVINRLSNNAIFIFTGVPGHKPPFQIDTDLIERNLVLKNQLVLGSVNNSYANAQEAVHDIGVFIQRWPNALPQLLTQRFSIDAPNLQDVLLGRVGGIKNTIHIAD